MLISNFIIIILIFFVITIFYQRYMEKNYFLSEDDNNKAIQSYLLTEIDIIYKTKKPIIWIYIPYEYNARHWQSFGSRSSCDLNQPYLYLTAKSIIKNCDESFKICFIDDSSFKKLIPNWNIDMSLISDPVLSYVR